MPLHQRNISVQVVLVIRTRTSSGTVTEAGRSPWVHGTGAIVNLCVLQGLREQTEPVVVDGSRVVWVQREQPREHPHYTEQSVISSAPTRVIRRRPTVRIPENKPRITITSQSTHRHAVIADADSLTPASDVAQKMEQGRPRGNLHLIVSAHDDICILPKLVPRSLVFLKGLLPPALLCVERGAACSRHRVGRESIRGGDTNELVYGDSATRLRAHRVFLGDGGRVPRDVRAVVCARTAAYDALVGVAKVERAEFVRGDGGNADGLNGGPDQVILVLKAFIAKDGTLCTSAVQDVGHEDIAIRRRRDL